MRLTNLCMIQRRMYESICPEGEPEKGDEERCAIPARDAVDQESLCPFMAVCQQQLQIILT